MTQAKTYGTSGTTGPAKTFTVSAEIAKLRQDRTSASSGEGYAQVKVLMSMFGGDAHSVDKFAADCAARGVTFIRPDFTSWDAFSKVIIENKVDGLMGSANGLVNYIQNRAEGDKSRFGYLSASGSPMTQAQSKAIREALLAPGGKFSFRYGNSAFGGTVAVGLAENTVDKLPGCVGKPLPDVEIKIIDGVIWAKAPFVIGYDDPKLSGKFVDGFLCLDDTGYLTPDGMIVLTGRVSEVIKDLK